MNFLKYFIQLDTNHFIQGEQLILNTKNQYFSIINNNYQVKDLNKLTHFHPSSYLDKLNYDPSKHIIVRLEFNKNKQYFIESNQAITVDNPDVTIINNVTSIKELLFINFSNG